MIWDSGDRDELVRACEFDWSYYSGEVRKGQVNAARYDGLIHVSREYDQAVPQTKMDKENVVGANEPRSVDGYTSTSTVIHHRVPEDAELSGLPNLQLKCKGSYHEGTLHLPLGH